MVECKICHIDLNQSYSISCYSIRCSYCWIRLCANCSIGRILSFASYWRSGDRAETVCYNCFDTRHICEFCLYISPLSNQCIFDCPSIESYIQLLPKDIKRLIALWHRNGLYMKEDSWSPKTYRRKLILIYKSIIMGKCISCDTNDLKYFTSYPCDNCKKQLLTCNKCYSDYCAIEFRYSNREYDTCRVYFCKDCFKRVSFCKFCLFPDKMPHYCGRSNGAGTYLSILPKELRHIIFPMVGKYRIGTIQLASIIRNSILSEPFYNNDTIMRTV